MKHGISIFKIVQYLLFLLFFASCQMYTKNRASAHSTTQDHHTTGPCESAVAVAKQKDDSILWVCQSVTDADYALVTVTVYVLTADYNEWKTVLIKEIDGTTEADNFIGTGQHAEKEPPLVELTDFNKDGFSEILIRDSRHVGLVNNPFHFFVFNPVTISIDHVGVFAADGIEFVNDALIISARIGCCARGFTVLDWPTKEFSLPESFQIDIWIHAGHEDNDNKTETFCRFTQEDKIIPPPDEFWLRYCEVFTEDYSLVFDDTFSKEPCELFDMPPILDDESQFPDIPIERENIGRFKGMCLSTQRRCKFSKGDWFELELIVHWQLRNGTLGKSFLYSGMSTTCSSMQIAGDELVLFIPGTRYDAEGSYTKIFFRWTGEDSGFVEERIEIYDHWEENMNLYKKYLNRGDWTGAVSQMFRIGTTPNSGHSFEAEKMAQMFFNTFYDHINNLYQQDNKKQAVDLAIMLLFSPPKVLLEECNIENINWSWPYWVNTSKIFCIDQTDENISRLTGLAKLLKEQSKVESLIEQDKMYELQQFMNHLALKLQAEKHDLQEHAEK
jgi:hypothetical protein